MPAIANLKYLYNKIFLASYLTIIPDLIFSYIFNNLIESVFIIK